MKRILFLFFAAGMVVFSACEKDAVVTPSPATTTSIRLAFENYVGMQPLTLGSTYRYVNANNDSFSCTTYKYYISNITFTDSNNNTWSEPNSYHLINAGDQTSLSFYIYNIPVATYTSISFMIGVDSARNVSGAQTGALDPANGMYWTWNSGYVMAKFKGYSSVTTSSDHSLLFDIGGYHAPSATQRIVSPSFGSDAAVVTTNATPTIHVKSDVLEWFQTPTVISFTNLSSITSGGTNAMTMADNYADMFSITRIDN